MPRLYALADVLLIHLRDDPLFRITIPSKTFAYLASGKPILAAIAGDTAEVVLDANAGLACPPEDAAALAAVVRRFYQMTPLERQHMSESGRAAVCAKYSREPLVTEIEAVLQAALASNRHKE